MQPGARTGRTYHERRASIILMGWLTLLLDLFQQFSHY